MIESIHSSSVEVIDMRAKILVVEDESNIQDVCRRYLEREGYFVVTANNGKEGFALFLQEQPNLLVVDVMMPEQDENSQVALSAFVQALAKKKKAAGGCVTTPDCPVSPWGLPLPPFTVHRSASATVLRTQSAAPCRLLRAALVPAPCASRSLSPPPPSPPVVRYAKTNAAQVGLYALLPELGSATIPDHLVMLKLPFAGEGRKGGAAPGANDQRFIRYS
jgi:CheY-like chemotaxis protein